VYAGWYSMMKQANVILRKMYRAVKPFMGAKPENPAVNLVHHEAEEIRIRAVVEIETTQTNLIWVVTT